MNIVIVGCGRMGQGIALTYALAGYSVHLLDAKTRPPIKFLELLDQTQKDLYETLNILHKIDLIKKLYIKGILKKITILKYSEFYKNLNSADVIFECVPEKLKIKKHILELLGNVTNKKTIISSTTSTILSNELSQFVKFPERFLNAHWLNPPYLMPLIEISPAKETNIKNINKIFKLFKSIGKIPIKCSPSPGYIVPRIQTLAMNEAARIYQEKIASSEDIDKSVIYGFGLRFAVLGLLEFIDWGGVDTLNNASDYMTKSMKDKRFTAPNIIKQHVNKNNLGISTKSGFMDWKNIDIKNYQEQKLRKFIEMTKLLGIKPKIKIT